MVVELERGQLFWQMEMNQATKSSHTWKTCHKRRRVENTSLNMSWERKSEWNCMCLYSCSLLCDHGYLIFFGIRTKYWIGYIEENPLRFTSFSCIISSNRTESLKCVMLNFSCNMLWLFLSCCLYIVTH